MTNDNQAYQQAAAQMSSIADMVAALRCDFDRLEELRDELDCLQYNVKEATDAHEKMQQSGEQFDFHGNTANEVQDELEDAQKALQSWLEDNADELRELEEAAGDCKDSDEARTRIEQDALSVEVRSAWVSVGEDMTPDQFRIVLCTGGPHVELEGELDEHLQPYRVWMNYKSWGESGEYHGENFDHDALIAYCLCFYFGG